jgi:hypothetical protein
MLISGAFFRAYQESLVDVNFLLLEALHTDSNYLHVLNRLMEMQ